MDSTTDDLTKKMSILHKSVLGSTATQKSSMKFIDNISIGDKYSPAMRCTEQEDADSYFEACVEHSMRFGYTREQAEQIERSNLGYYAGYYDFETRLRVERLFKCVHPIFGSAAINGQPSAEQALMAGYQMASVQKE